jgi:hypothetical protein
MKYDLYAPERNFTAIPDLELVKISGDDRDRSVHFLWRGTKQWLAMSKDNHYGDNEWLVVKTDYTEDFENFLDEELGGYDSLESTFELSDIIPLTYDITFEVGE